MAFPSHKRIWGSDLAGAQETVSRLVKAISCYEKVCLLVPPNDEKRLAKSFGPSEVEVIAARYNDIWVRDTLPTFAVGSDKSLYAIDWHFNGWGDFAKLKYRNDLKIGREVARIANAKLIDSGVVAEGGAFAFDGHGLIVVTESTIFDPRRNPRRDKKYLENALLDAAQCSSICWLPGDQDEEITRGHADAIFAFVKPNVVLFHWIDEPDNPERGICEDNLRVFQNWSEKTGRKFEIINVPSLPSEAHRGRGDNYCASYVNFAHVNGAVIVPKHGYEFAKYDDRASRIIAEVSKKPTISVDVSTIAVFGGSIHCATQQEPLTADGPKKLRL